MKKNNIENKPTNFWFGFSLGTVVAGAAAYFLGSAKGRQSLKKLIEVSENLPENLPKLLDQLKKPEKNDKENGDKKNQSSALNTLETIISKIKDSSSEKLQKKVFVKSS